MTGSEGFADLDVDYTRGEGETADDYPTLTEKVETATDVVRTALDEYRNPAVVWTGGRDSTLVLYVVREVTREHGFEAPSVVFVADSHPDSFVQRWMSNWELDLVVAGGDASDAIADHGFDAVLSGTRWDEQGGETFFSPRRGEGSPHDRVQPILQFDEAAVWDATWGFVVPDTVVAYPSGYVPQGVDDLPAGVDLAGVPVSPTYFGGRPENAPDESGDDSDRPAWLS